MKTQILYRFFKASDGIDTLERGRLRIGRIAGFSDPFEWRPGIRAECAGSLLKTQAVIETAFSEMNKQFGLICFSSSCREPVLWSHYGESHRGIAIEFELPCGPSLERVEYCDDRVTIEPQWIGDSGQKDILSQALTKVTVRKSTGWSYEREWRLSVTLREEDHHEGSYWVEFDKVANVKRVILGEFCPAWVELAIRRLLAAHEGYSHVVLTRGRRSHHTCLVDIE